MDKLKKVPGLDAKRERLARLRKEQENRKVEGGTLTPPINNNTGLSRSRTVGSRLNLGSTRFGNNSSIEGMDSIGSSLREGIEPIRRTSREIGGGDLGNTKLSGRELPNFTRHSRRTTMDTPLFAPPIIKNDLDKDLDSILGVRTETNSSSSSTSNLINEKVGIIKNRPVPKLSTSKVLIYDIPPKEKVVYTKDIQTTLSMNQAQHFDEEEVNRRVLLALELEEKERKLKKIEEEEEEKLKLELLEKETNSIEDENNPESKVLNEEIKTNILSSQPFVEFLNQSSKIIERALCETYDYLSDYTINDLSKNGQAIKDTVKLISVFYDDKLTRNRSITDVNWCPKFKELIAVSYNKNVLANTEPDGQVLVWNLHLDKTPEFCFVAQSDILTIKYSKYHPNLLIGGTYSGQILIWDTQSKTQLPSLSSPLTSIGHTHPIYNLQLVGTNQANSIISASTDGLICTWQMDMLAQPQDTLDLVHTNHSRTDEVAVTQLGFLSNETSSFLVGTEEGTLYHAHRYERAGSKAGIHPHHYYKGHTGPVTGLSCHPTQTNGKIDFSDLILTCSVDWSVKLWRTKSPIQTTLSAPLPISPLHSFEFGGDYVYDVQWSPIHPAMFAVVDGLGSFDIWNLNADIETPIISTKVSDKALNKVVWHEDGTKVAIGSSDGKLFIYQLGEFAIPTPDDWDQFHTVLSDLYLTSSNPVDHHQDKNFFKG